jgi:hypothetical protein
VPGLLLARPIPASARDQPLHVRVVEVRQGVDVDLPAGIGRRQSLREGHEQGPDPPSPLAPRDVGRPLIAGPRTRRSRGVSRTRDGISTRTVCLRSVP